jgi:hypothetical protein
LNVEEKKELQKGLTPAVWISCPGGGGWGEFVYIPLPKGVKKLNGFVSSGAKHFYRIL